MQSARGKLRFRPICFASLVGFLYFTKAKLNNLNNDAKDEKVWVRKNKPRDFLVKIYHVPNSRIVTVYRSEYWSSPGLLVTASYLNVYKFHR